MRRRLEQLGAVHGLQPETAGCPGRPNGDLDRLVYRYNYAATHYLQRIDERYTAGFFGHLKFNDHVEAYTEFMFMDDDTRGNYAPAGSFLRQRLCQPAGTNIRDGNLHRQLRCRRLRQRGNEPVPDVRAEFGASAVPASTCGHESYDPVTGDAQLLIARRNVEGGPREDKYTHTAYRGVFGARGEIATDWNYDASFTYGRPGRPISTTTTRPRAHAERHCWR